MSLTAALPLTGTSPTVVRPRIAGGAARKCVRLFSTTVTVLVSIVAALAIVLAVASRMSPGGQATVFGHPVLSMLSGSMTGTINTGDFIVDDRVTAAQAQNLQVGQVVTFRVAPDSTILVTHRIIAVRNTDGAVSYITKGDANNAQDATPRPASDAVGTLRFAIPHGAYVLAALRTPRVLGLLLISVILWFVAASLIRVAIEETHRS